MDYSLPGFSALEILSGLPFPTPRDPPNPGIEPTWLRSPSLAGVIFTTGPLGKPNRHVNITQLLPCSLLT